MAYLDLEFPLRYDSNHPWLDRSVAGVTAVALHLEAERVLADAGLRHREVQVAIEEDGHTLGMGFSELGYMGEHLVVMAHERDPVKSVPSVAEIVDFAEARPGIQASIEAEPWADTDQIVRQLTLLRGAC